MSNRYQVGSLAGFIVVGVLLALVLIGGLYGLNRYNAQKATETAAAEKNKTDKQNKETAKSDDTSKKTESPTPQPATPSSNESTSNSSEKSSNHPASVNTNLPQTGPADTLAQLVAITALAFAVTTYARSRAHA